VAAQVEAYARTLSTPVQLALLGPGQADLTTAAHRAVEAIGRSWSPPRSWPDPGGETRGGGAARVLRGLFAGGTLCDEAMLLAADRLGPVYSNIPLRDEWRLGRDLRHDGHVMIDFGDDALTQGRAHPMIDQRTRLDRLAAEAADPAAKVVLLDVVLGHGAHPDPAAELAPALHAARASAAAVGGDLALVVSLCAAEGDPQGLARQAEALQAAGAAVFLSNAAAARAAVELVDVVEVAR
jgi:FdrA protein